MDKRLAVFFKQFSFTSIFGVKNAKSTFLREIDFESGFIKFTYRWLQTGLSDLINIKQ